MIDAIMGHANDKPDYGHIDLAAKLEVMNQVVARTTWHWSRKGKAL
jgi:hypothetical protein